MSILCHSISSYTILKPPSFAILVDAQMTRNNQQMTEFSPYAYCADASACRYVTTDSKLTYLDLDLDLDH